MLYGMGKYVFVAGATEPDAAEKSDGVSARRTAPESWFVGAVRLVGHADVRWHLWIVLAACGRLDAALVGYAAYFPARALLGAAQEGGAPCLIAACLVLILAKNEAHNLPCCLDTVNWANEVIVVVDRASRDDTQAIASREGRPRRRPHVRRLREPAQRRARAGVAATGSSPSTPTSARRPNSPPKSAASRPTQAYLIMGIRVPIRSVILGRPVSLLRDAVRPAAAPLRRGSGRWVGTVHETVELDGTAGRLQNALQHRTIPDMQTFLRKLNEYTTLEAIKFEREGRTVPRGRPGRAAGMDVREALRRQARISRRPRRLRVLRLVGAVRRRPPLEASRIDPAQEGVMTLTSALYEDEVAARFDELRGAVQARRCARRTTDWPRCWNSSLRSRTRACWIWAAARGGSRRDSANREPTWSVSTSRPRCSARRWALRRVRGSARRLPFADEAFDAVVAVEMFEHLPALAVSAVLARNPARPETRRPARHRRQERAVAERPTAVAAESGGQMDRRTARPLDVPADGPVRERWFGPAAFRRQLQRVFIQTRVSFPLAPDEAEHALFRRLPRARRAVLWTAQRAGRPSAMTNLRPSSLPVLPLLLWETPPGLELALAQEGVSYRVIQSSHPLAFRAGRFVLYDGRRVSASQLRRQLAPEHVAIDIDRFRRSEPIDPFRALIETRARIASWEIDGWSLTERVARHPKAELRARIVGFVRAAVVAAGGMWARLGAFPFPYRSAFNFRADLDERCVEDYSRFARARRRLADCVTHFVCTQAYGDVPAVLQDLLRVDTQSHGHYHLVYRDPDANLRNLRRADALLRESGFEPAGYAAPHGRWNPGLDDAIEAMGYVYSSDFQLGYDDLPFFPWRADAGRFSRVLQVPIHPICEGLFFEAGATGGKNVAEHLVRVVRAKIAAGAPAFVYGHPEGRLAHHPDVLTALADAIAHEALVWRVTLTEFAHWWRWRASRSWSVVARGGGRFEIQFDDWGTEFPLSFELARDQHVATIPLTGPLTPLQLDGLAYERRQTRVDLPVASSVARPPSCARSSAARSIGRRLPRSTSCPRIRSPPA